MQDIARNRYKGDTRKAFGDLKKITGYDKFAKKEGEIISKIYFNDDIVCGDRMNDIIISYIKRKYGALNQPTR